VGEAQRMKHEALIVTPGQHVKLSQFDPKFTGEFQAKADALDKLSRGIEHLAALQDALAASRANAVLVVLQGMDASGKDGAIKHVMSGVNPQGVHVFSFKVPSEEELLHDFLWRYERALPERGRIGIFNRSYYEEVLVVRVHRELLANEQPQSGGDVWKQRYDDINAFEHHLARNGTLVVKFFLHMSKDEQRKRLLERLDDPSKTWKFSLSDVHEREYWDDYSHAYEQLLNHTSTDWAPWHVIPADHKWFTRAAIADILVEKLKSLDLRYPVVDDAKRATLENVRKLL
jgi:PPK2 family polyphosphate:nucleotide phosphotransferase